MPATNETLLMTPWTDKAAIAEPQRLIVEVTQWCQMLTDTGPTGKEIDGIVSVPSTSGSSNCSAWTVRVLSIH